MEREKRGWPKTELARRAGMNQVTVGQIELGRYIPYNATLERLARALEFTEEPEALLQEVPDEREIHNGTTR